MMERQAENKRNVLFSLPVELVLNTLSDWVDLFTIVKLDTAVCQRAIRGLHLTVLSSEPFFVSSLTALSLERKDADPNNPSADTHRLRWLHERCIKVKQIELAYDCHLNAISNYLEKFGKHVQKVKHYTPELDYYNPAFEMSFMMMGWMGTRQPPSWDDKSKGKVIATHCKNLISYHCYMLGMGDEGFVSVLCSNPGLQQLTIEGDYLGPGNAASITQVSLPNLRQLVFLTKYGFDQVLTAFARAAPNLEKLKIACHPCKCSELPRGLIAEVGRQCPKLRSFSSRELHIGSNDDDLRQFFQTCPNIVNLDLQSHRQLTDGTLITALSCLQELHSIDLSFCPKLSDRTLSFLAERFAHTLQVLHLGGNDGMTQSAIEILRSKCTQLHTCHYMYSCKGEPLDADKLKKTTILQVVDLHIDVDVTVLIEQSQQLQVLDLSESEGEILTAEELTDIARGCPNLHTVVVSTRETRKGECSAMQKAYPKLLFTTDKVRADFDVLAMPV